MNIFRVYILNGKVQIEGEDRHGHSVRELREIRTEENREYFRMAGMKWYIDELEDWGITVA